MKFEPHKYQTYAINHILKHPYTGLFLDMGLGKTVSALTAADDLLFLGKVNKVLVVAPLRVALDTWSGECEKWDHLQHLKISKILGPEKARRSAMLENSDIYVINRENVSWLVKNYFNDWKFDMLIIDELSSFKDQKSIRFKELKKVRGYFKWIVGLTGTPAPNNLIQLWPQLYLLDQGKRLGPTMSSYKQKYFSAGAGKGHIIFNWLLRKGSEKMIYWKIHDICISMKNKDYIDMPDQITNIIKVKLNDSAMKKYKDLEKDLILQIGDKNITVANSAVLCNKLLQMANGAVYDEKHEVVKIHDEKLKALLDVIEAANGKPVLIFYSYKHDYTRIDEFLRSKGMKISGLENSADIKKWNEGKTSILCCHPASVGHGLNLQAGGHIIVWYGLTWSLELYQQANARLHRQGQKETVIINHIIAENTIDELVMKALKGKAINQRMLLEAVKVKVNKAS